MFSDIDASCAVSPQAMEAVQQAREHDPECPQTHFLAFKLALLLDKVEEGELMVVEVLDSHDMLYCDISSMSCRALCHNINSLFVIKTMVYHQPYY